MNDRKLSYDDWWASKQFRAYPGTLEERVHDLTKEAWEAALSAEQPECEHTDYRTIPHCQCGRPLVATIGCGSHGFRQTCPGPQPEPLAPTCSHGYGYENEHHRVRCSIPGPQPEPLTDGNRLLIEGLEDLAALNPRDDARSLCARAASALRFFYGARMAQPAVTREQIATLLWERDGQRRIDYTYFLDDADAVLALIERKP